MTDVAVVVPWSPGCPHREAALSYVARRWEDASLPVVLGYASPGAWCKADAVADALSRTDAELLVVADADVWTEGVFEAIERVRSGEPWAVPHWLVHRLSPTATAAVLEGAELSAGLEHSEGPYKGVEGGGMVVLPRELYERVPLDHRFRGWGQEDESWALALRTLAGLPWRGRSDLFHLWHPPQRRDSRRFGSRDSKRLYFCYVAARNKPHRMDDLLTEPREEVIRRGSRNLARAEGEPASSQPTGSRQDHPLAGR